MHEVLYSANTVHRRTNRTSSQGNDEPRNLHPQLRHADRDGPVQPQDVQDLGEIPLGDGESSLQIRDDGATITTNINGVPTNLRIDRNGLSVQPSGRLPTPTPVPIPAIPRPDRLPPQSTAPPPER